MALDKIRCWTDFRRNPFMWITGEPEIGKGTWIGAFTVIDGAGGLKIGNNCDISCGVHIYTHEMQKGKPVRKPTEIGNNIYIGANAIIMMGSKIEDNAIIGAGAVVLKDTHIKKGEVWAGIPAKLKAK